LLICNILYYLSVNIKT